MGRKRGGAAGGGQGERGGVGGALWCTFVCDISVVFSSLAFLFCFLVGTFLFVASRVSCLVSFHIRAFSLYSIFVKGSWLFRLPKVRNLFGGVSSSRVPLLVCGPVSPLVLLDYMHGINTLFYALWDSYAHVHPRPSPRRTLLFPSSLLSPPPILS